MHVLSIGLNHTTAPVAVRERAAHTVPAIPIAGDDVQRNIEVVQNFAGMRELAGPSPLGHIAGVDGDLRRWRFACNISDAAAQVLRAGRSLLVLRGFRAQMGIRYLGNDHQVRFVRAVVAADLTSQTERSELRRWAASRMRSRFASTSIVH